MFKIEKLIFLLKKCIYFISYRNEHPVKMNWRGITLDYKHTFIINQNGRKFFFINYNIISSFTTNKKSMVIVLKLCLTINIFNEMPFGQEGH